MNSKTYQCLSCRIKEGVRQTRHFSTSPKHHARRRPAYPSVKQAQIEAAQAEKERVDRLSQRLKPYTDREKSLLAMRYTRGQMRIIEQGEEAVDAKEMVSQGKLRGDAFRPTYLDDFATRRPLVDKPLPGATRAPEAGEEGERRGKKDKALRIPGVQYGSDVEDPHMKRLCQQTRLTPAEIKRIRVKNLVSHRVVNQTRLGKIQSLYFLTIAGNQDGMLGIGEGKAAEDEDGRRQAMMNAIRNMKPVARYEERTIYGDVSGKSGGAVVELSSRPPGFGNRCQSLIFELARAAGISDLAARTPRSRNKMNVVKAAYQALMSQRLPEDVARSRGRKMVDVRKVYYGGQVY
ncbi:mitochondrial 37S ribosomal protein MRPS5 [Teratosphaeria destructans]|uniref:Small ribosomal subunit protein uS5m n=1 Tax=Teratosphaeria destructans TaxID=418781 RepID=A0A9W7SUJ4_9PEZI|nr:mitochondrial 37S ribosomal protein MRPS5 [Teratosphaeria destructans]